ncbi:unnamed protein product [Meganyctiphanes norvegica]|uniref:Ubiquitin-like domain-containing protein n=1 Tax=Meganyctiphanes norvegica TaxID=48144 RepID=A0AAV2R178_MEGNR
MEANVTLIIKAANQSVPDHRLECESDWTVLLLKNHLSNIHPSKPSVKEQRLIYSGQLLVDHLVLRNVLRHPSENNSYTIHLVCSPPRNNTTTTTTATVTPAVATINPAVTMATAAPSSIPPENIQVSSTSSGASVSINNPTSSELPLPSTDSSTDGVRRRFVSPEVSTSTTATNIGGPTPYMNPTPQFPQELITSGDPMHQMAIMQQMYAQYMNSYMQYMQMGGAMSGMMWPGQMMQPAAPMAPPPNPQVTVATAATEPQEPRVDANAQPQPQQQQQQQQQQQPQIRMNAQGGEVDEEEEGEEGVGRDWLDWIYMASRCAVLLSIVYFYSTPSRFMLVICIAMLLYLYQAGWFRPARRIEPPVPREGNNNNINRNDNNNQDDRNNNINNNNNNNLVNEVQQERVPDEANANLDDQNPAENNETTERVVEDVPARPSFLNLSWTFLTTFFTSLIPEQPQIV